MQNSKGKMQKSIYVKGKIKQACYIVILAKKGTLGRAKCKMQNAKSRKGVLCCASGKERDPRDNGHYYQINIEPSQYGIILQNRTEAFPKRENQGIILKMSNDLHFLLEENNVTYVENIPQRNWYMIHSHKLHTLRGL